MRMPLVPPLTLVLWLGGLIGAVGVLGLGGMAGCAPSRGYRSAQSSELKGRGAALWAVADNEWERLGARIEASEPVDPARVYQLAEIRIVLMGGQISSIFSGVEPEARAMSEGALDWAERAIAAYMAGEASPPFPQHLRD